MSTEIDVTKYCPALKILSWGPSSNSSTHSKMFFLNLPRPKWPRPYYNGTIISKLLPIMSWNGLPREMVIEDIAHFSKIFASNFQQVI